jgi:Putative oxalocrotonate tautomerase enzyme
MPYYQFNVHIPITETQRQALVDHVIRIHTRKFHVATFLVQVGFQDLRASGDRMIMYRAGTRHEGNFVQCFVRPGGRDRALFDEVCLEVKQAWDDVLNDGKSDVKGPTELSGCFVQAIIHAAWEHGVLVPPGGQDTEWMLKNRGYFEKRAAEGDMDFKFLLKEMDTREDMGCVGQSATN